MGGNRTRIAWRCAVLGAMLLVAGCVTTAQKQVETLKRPGPAARVVLMPLDVELAELSAGGINEPKAEWTEQGRTLLLAAMRRAESDLGIALGEYDESRAPPEQADRLVQIQRLHGVVGATAMVHHYVTDFQLPSKRGRFDWTLGPEVKPLGTSTGADYALFVHVRDSYSSAGRVAVQVLAALMRVQVQGGQQLGFASLVDLDSGEIVWFNRLARGAGDLRNPEGAAETARTLLADFPK